MKLSIKKLSYMALLVAMTMMQTSCDELLGEADNPVPPVSDVTLDETTLEMVYGNGKDITLEATVSPADTEDFDVTWSSSDESVATVDDEGVVHAVGAGTADDEQINANVPWKKGINGIPAGWTIAAAAAE